VLGMALVMAGLALFTLVSSRAAMLPARATPVESA